jgi:hypothetical protein
VRLTTYHHIVPMSRNLGALSLLDPFGPAWPVMGVLYLYIQIYKLSSKQVGLRRGVVEALFWGLGRWAA